jgi:hypothetical protein
VKRKAESDLFEVLVQQLDRSDALLVESSAK